ncbi:MAG TPA: HAMP domain-containing sensor histidine kinase [Acidobacteriaceae bacterium]|nr:HAMP domain-containing sensor histidine kinase [Acidobacteriaceae bacterium]
MRTTLMVSLLAVSLGLTATCLLIIRLSVQQEIRKGLESDLAHSFSTFRNISRQRNEMLSREAGLLADLPSLKALMATQDPQTIQDGSPEFWTISGSDFFALLGQNGKLFTHLNRGTALTGPQVEPGLRACMAAPEDAEQPCRIAFGRNLYELSIRQLYFGSPANDSRLGYVVIGYVIGPQEVQDVREAAAADVAVLVDGEISATTVAPERLPDLRLANQRLNGATKDPETIQLDHESYLAAASPLALKGQGSAEFVVLKSYDRARDYLRRVNQWVLALGLSSLAIGLMLATAISRTVTRPLEALVAGARALGQGDFTYSLTNEGAVEVRELSLAFDRMRGELKRTQAELIAADRLATIGRMASSVSHDLRHHLSAIYANAEFMSDPHARDEERDELLTEVRDGVQGMTNLIESLLLFSQTGQVLQIRHESLTQLVERTVSSVHQHPECRDVAIAAEGLPAVTAWVDGTKLGRALYNLILNACQAARNGVYPPVVSVTLAEDDEKIRIGIADNGRGVPAAIRHTLFQPFVSAGKENGVGLGLTLAQHIAQEHGGEVRLELSVAGNTSFSVILYKRWLSAHQPTVTEPAVFEEH